MYGAVILHYITEDYRKAILTKNVMDYIIYIDTTLNLMILCDENILSQFEGKY